MLCGDYCIVKPYLILSLDQRMFSSFSHSLIAMVRQTVTSDMKKTMIAFISSILIIHKILIS